MSENQDYLLGTDDREIARLGLQHRVWRPRVLDAWRRAGFTVGQTLVDLGCGPGFAALDLAEIVGPSGRVVAYDRSPRFLQTLERAAAERRIAHVATAELDLDADDLPLSSADGAWCRWVFAFLRRPRELLAKLSRSLRPGGVLVVHEYFDYRTWRLAPRCAEIEEFVAAVSLSWRAAGGDPDIGLELPGWLGESGFAIREVRPIIDVVSPASYVWQWPKSFLAIHLRRLVELGQIREERAEEIQRAIDSAERRAGTLMITPAVLEVIAEKHVAGSFSDG